MTGVPPKKAFSRTLAAESFGLRLIVRANETTPSSPWCKSYIRSSPQAGYEALGNVLRIFSIAWQFRREHAIF